MPPGNHLEPITVYRHDAVARRRAAMTIDPANARGDTGAVPEAPLASFALGLGLTNECNLACAFCYRDTSRVDRLAPAQVKAVLDRIPVRSVNLGTGENGMHPKFRTFLRELRSRPLKLTITSNGRSIELLADEELRAFSDVEFSLDYPNEAEQDAERGPGNWRLLHEQAARCVRLGIPVTFIAVMMKLNHLRLAEIAAIARGFNAPLRVNVYQAVRSDAFALSYEEYWAGFRALFAATDVIAIGEPLIRAFAGLPRRTGGCGVATIRVTPRATTQPCVYWPGQGGALDELLDNGSGIVESASFRAARSVPAACEPCAFRDSCRGGCAGRRRLLGALDQPDPYCPIIRDERQPLAVKFLPSRDLPKSESACTTIVMGRA
jgi:radical SAM protein with 4Fe4S-binding SPASM domain